MRLSEWRANAPHRDPVAPRVMAVSEQALVALGSERDPECWVAWGDDPDIRYLILAPTPSGLVQVNVRVAVPGEGPRAAGKIIRWNRLQLGELAVEIQGGHRLVTFQVETFVLNGTDATADVIAAFAQALFAAVDGRPTVTPTPAGARAGGATKQGALARSAGKGTR
jgi:hypothetical protein